MKYLVITAPFLKVDGMALFPFILVKRQSMKQDQVLIRHETIHLRQAAEMLVIPFYVLYLVNYIINRFKYNNHHQAYMQIVFEREAYQHEKNVNYLQTRKLYAWMSYLK
ncbi:hypothetical protein [Mucilaginibacter sp. CSA2-8R]|uniref:hypothetical protein n=1 Tax=Mucilaginibacter sp. CSA2-8R TaxID=3141542 RepID=UPI00315CA810